MRIAFTLIDGKAWAGGYNYLLNLLRVVTEEAPGEVVPVLFVGEDVADRELSPFAAIPGCEIVRHGAFARGRRARSLIESCVFGRDAAVSSLFDAHRIDVVFENATFFGWRLGRPAIAWIPDLQHRYLPHLFSAPRWIKRELGFRAQCASGRSIMVSSEDSRSTFLRCYPGFRGPIRAVRFAVKAPPAVAPDAARGVADRYGLPPHYFFMPNQFWKHKNHLLVVEAVALARRQGADVTVVATGEQSDPRNPSHVAGVLAAIRREGLERAFVTPGRIPYEDVLPLMTASAALLNPSLFEGWSTIVEEARALGVPMILSDLDVHREQAAAEALYFERSSAESLAKVLREFKPLSAEARKQRSIEAEATVSGLRRRFALDFVDLARTAAHESISLRRAHTAPPM